jgi:O-antigen/teichoic acid export membrane protein
MNSSSNNKIISHGRIYLAGNILQRCVSFVMLPIYTRFLTPADYGTIELLSMILDFVGIILGLRINESIFRFYAEYDDPKDKNAVITTAIYLVFFLNFIGISIIYAASGPLTQLVFGDDSQRYNLMIFSLTLLMQVFIEIPMVYLKAIQRPWVFVTFSILKLTLQLSLNIIFVVVMKLQVSGVIYSAVVSSIVMGTILSGFIIKSCGIGFSISKAKELISFSLPLILTGILSFYITFGDRYFLRVNAGLDTVGIYSLAYKFGFLLSFLVVNPFNAIWSSEKYRIAKSNQNDGKFGEIFNYYTAIVIIVCIGITVFVKDALRIMAAPEFWGAATIVPIILAAYFSDALSAYVNLGILLRNKTIEITYGTLIAALIITTGYLILIPLYGAVGAAFATVLALGSRCVWVYFRAKRLYNMHLEWRSTWVLVLLWITVYTLSRFGNNLSLVGSFIWDSILVMAIITVLLFLPILPLYIRIKIREKIFNWRSLLFSR